MRQDAQERISQQVAEFVGGLKRMNEESQRRGGPRISEAEYQKLANELVSQVVKRANGGLHAQRSA